MAELYSCRKDDKMGEQLLQVSWRMAYDVLVRFSSRRRDATVFHLTVAAFTFGFREKVSNTTFIDFEHQNPTLDKISLILIISI